MPITINDIVLAVKLARECDWSISVKSHGYSTNGSSVQTNSLLIDMSNFTNINIDYKYNNVSVGAGATWNSIVEAVQPLKIVVGPWNLNYGAGVILDGTSGPLINSHGLPIDFVINYCVVTIDGEIKVATATENEELFWALKGAGAQNLGIIVSYTIEMFDANHDFDNIQSSNNSTTTLSNNNINNNNIFSLSRTWGVDHVGSVLGQWGKLFSGDLSRAVISKIDINKNGITLENAYLGPASKGASACSVFDVSQKPISQLSSTSSSFTTWCQKVSPKDSGYMVLIQNAIVSSLDTEIIEAITQLTNDAPTNNNNNINNINKKHIINDFWNINIEFVYGAVTDCAPSFSAYPHRTKSVHITISAYFRSENTEELWNTWIQKFSTIKSKSTGISPAIPENSSSENSIYWGTNYPLLQTIKKANDPQNFFTNPQGVINQ